MGLSTASVRHPHVMVMAPALTKTTQSQSFKIPPSSPTTQPTTTLHTNRDVLDVYQSLEGDSCEKTSINELANDNLNTLALVSELLKGNRTTCKDSDIMSSAPLHMGDQKDKMGLRKAGIDIVSAMIKEKTSASDDDQLNNFETGDGTACAEIGQDEFMQVIKCIESNSDKLGASASDLTSETDSVFPLSTDLTSNLTSFEKELLNDVDVMSISIEEQLTDTKETGAKELLANLQKKHTTLQRKLEYTLRRLRKLQAKQIGQHASEEIAGVFEHVHRTMRRKDSPPGAGEISEKLKPISLMSAKNIIKKLEVSTSLQANALGRRHMSRYFGAGSVEPNSFRTGVVGALVVPQWTPEHKLDMQRVTGHLCAEVNLLQNELDSEATLSSSGGESSDEMQPYSNPHQQYLAIQKRAVWRFAVERAAIAYRWEWLHAQITELEYRIRQYSDLHKQIRLNKGSVVLGGTSPPHTPSVSPTVVNGYRGQLPGASPLSVKSLETVNGAVSSNEPTSSRCRPVVGFRKRKVYQTHGLHVVSRKAARSSTIRCGCVPPCSQCGLCTGRTDPTYPRDITDHLSKSERISLLDPSFHPVFSLPEDASTAIHLEAIMKTSEWQHRSTRPNVKSVKFISKGDRSEKPNVPLDHQPKRLPDQRRKYNRLIKSSTMNALSNKIKSKLRGRKPNLHSFTRLKRKRHSNKLSLPHLPSSALESSNDEIDQIGNTSSSYKLDSRSSSPLLSTQPVGSYKRGSRVSSYDIDNIVIPYSVAASTRVEKLQYKEILTPKWRIIDPEFATKYFNKNNGLVREPDQDSDTEDFSEEAVMVRHDKCEYDEKKKFLSYLKFPYGSARARAHKRTDSRAESSGCNTPDPMSPHMGGEAIENTTSPLTSPPATPLSMNVEDSSSLPSISALRRRTISVSRGKDKDNTMREEYCSASPEHVEVIPYEQRVFPLSDDTYDKMLKLMPEHHQFKTNIRAQDYSSPTNYLNEAPDSPNSESTESAFGDEDPNDPEWMDLEINRDSYRR
uniref:PEHE domain-containing protein n=1 Tax=Photinus pyralis TaxID=7054 RepID=A0A1Y1LG98_PHOPY